MALCPDRVRDVTERRQIGPMATDITGECRQLGPRNKNCTVFYFLAQLKSAIIITYTTKGDLLRLTRSRIAS